MSIRLIETAKEIATSAHKDQTRRDGTPFIAHPERVATAVTTLGAPSSAIAAAWLHDSVEDSNAITVDFIRSMCGTQVASMVEALTSPPQSYGTRKRRKAKAREQLGAEGVSHWTKVIKLLDINDNLESIPKAEDSFGKRPDTFWVLWCREHLETLDVIGHADEAYAERLAVKLRWHISVTELESWMVQAQEAFWSVAHVFQNAGIDLREDGSLKDLEALEEGISGAQRLMRGMRRELDNRDRLEIDKRRLRMGVKHA